VGDGWHGWCVRLYILRRPAGRRKGAAEIEEAGGCSPVAVEKVPRLSRLPLLLFRGGGEGTSIAAVSITTDVLTVEF
jgi:hypothetical protein